MKKLVIIGLSLLVMSCASMPDSNGIPKANTTIKTNKKNKYTTVDDLENLDKINYQLGVDYIRSNHYEIAEEKLMAVIKRQPKFPDSYNALGVLQERRGKITEAIALFAKAISLNPYYSVAVNNYARLQCRANGPAALAAAANGASGTVRAGMYSGASECAIAKNDYQNALTYANNSTDADTRYALGHFYKAQSLFQLNRYDETLKSLDKYHDIEGYTEQGAKLGLLAAEKISNQTEINKYQHVINTQFINTQFND